jgi:hypothetical protein
MRFLSGVRKDITHAGRSQLHVERWRHLLNRAQEPRPIGIVWMVHEGHLGGAGRKLLERLQPFSSHRVLEAGESGNVAAWTCQTRYDSISDWVGDLHEDDRYALRRLLEHRRYDRAVGKNDAGFKADQVRRIG